MDKFLFLTVSLFISRAATFPVADDRIIFRDEDEVDDSPDDLLRDQSRLLLDSRILKSDNTSKEFLLDDKAQQKLEDGKFYQGDIVLMADQKEIIESEPDDDPFGTRTGILSEYYRWPKDKSEGKVIVPYTISDDYSFFDKIRIWLAMNDIEKYTCVEFQSRSRQEDYVHIQSGRGCSSNLGKLGGRQTISLKRDGCLSRGTIIHELIHALGYDHMHSHAERDQYVTIVWDNINRNVYDNFEKVNPRRFSNFGTPYDYHSVMHYTPTAFSKNGKRTIVPKDPKYRNVIGQRIGMSAGDAKRINNMYKCF